MKDTLLESFPLYCICGHNTQKLIMCLVCSSYVTSQAPSFHILYRPPVPAFNPAISKFAILTQLRRSSIWEASELTKKTTYPRAERCYLGWRCWSGASWWWRPRNTTITSSLISSLTGSTMRIPLGQLEETFTHQPATIIFAL